MRVITLLLVLISFAVAAYFWDLAESAIHQVLAISLGCMGLILARLAQAEGEREERRELQRPQLPTKES